MERLHARQPGVETRARIHRGWLGQGGEDSRRLRILHQRLLAGDAPPGCALHRRIDPLSQETGNRDVPDAVHYYVAGKLLWDISLDEREIVADFYTRAFGAVAP